MDELYGIERADLLKAASNSMKALPGTPFRVPDFFAAAPPDPRRCLAGSSLRISETEAGFAVKRRVYVESLEREFHVEELPSWFAQKTGKTLLLCAEAGEGKTTFKNLLFHHLANRFLILEWDVKSPLNPQQMRNFHACVRTYLPQDTVGHLPPEEPILIVFGETTARLKGPTADEICNYMAERADHPDPSVVLILGRPAELQRLIYGIANVEVIRLLPLNQEEASSLCTNLEKAYSQLNATGISDEELTNCYPNLLRFLNLDRPRQISLFLEPQKPLLAALLQAVYGDDCWKRLKEEFDLLPLPEQTAYMHICLASSAGAGVPESLLLWLAGGAQLHSYCRYNPWVRTESGNHVARHRVIAQTVIEESQAYGLLRQCLVAWLGAVVERGESPLLAWQIFNQVAEWEPTAPERKESGPFRGIIRQLAREAIGKRRDFIANLKTLVETDERHLLQWAGTIHALLPEEKPGRAHLFLFEDNRTLLEQVQSTTVDPSLPERIQYYLDKNERGMRRAKGETGTIRETSLRVKKWSQLMWKPWCGPDFYADLFIDAAELARALTVGPEQISQDSDQLMEVYVTAVRAFERLRLQSGYDEACKQLDIGVYSGLIARLLYQALPTKKTEVLQAAWEVSATTENPNFKTGVQYAKLLLSEEARHVLKTILDKHPTWGEAIFELVSLVKTEEQLSEARSYIQAGFKAEPSGLNLALLNHAAALVEKEATEREKFLRIAVQYYDEYVRSVKLPEEQEMRARLGQEACRELRKLTKDIPPECARLVERARKSRRLKLPPS